MNITHELRPPFTILRLEGSLDLQSAPVFRATVNSHLQAGRVHLVLDLTGVTFLDSSGLTAIVGAWTTISRLQSSLRACNLQSPVRRVFSLTRVDKALPLYPDLAAALADPPPVPANGPGAGPTPPPSPDQP
ncbi:MAG: hypothetical protein OZSIB_3199 [Candidatus Ozemobacter sibiricus]|uniref:Anti-sigma factor antagonist n=1 Tax=Candidatus Ozemobacter sibiricus TaxID=2268124 RepID=A0A367ZQR5_9BACT|nr:MAG: hypothetical protein OZSIB_3199 [Candidatus Ozemobacter sibiricus]